MDQTPPPPRGRWENRTLALLTGLALAPAGPVVWRVLQPSAQSLLFWLCWAAFAAGIAWALLALLLPQGRMLRLMRWITGNALVFAMMLGAAELGFRVAGVNFNDLTGQNDDPRAGYPLCFQLPDKPLGDIYFHRAGPVSWTGRPLQEFLRVKSGSDKTYQDEREFTADYDADGFRNPVGQTDWQVVVVGDSFVESGTLPFDQIFTSQAAQKSGLAIHNLGVCNTGTLSHLEYLRRFGKAPGTRHAVLAFYDGNDILDTEAEAADLERHRKTGWRPERVPQPQRSLIKAAYQVAKHLLHQAPSRRYQDAWLTAGGQEVPITIRPAPMPLDPETMTARQKDMLAKVVNEWAVTARQLGLEPWLLYLPANNRTYHGLLRFDSHADSAARTWVPGTLPAHMRGLCQAEGIRFLDGCGVLREAAEKGIPVYNPILDTHINAEGSRLIGELLAKHLADAMAGNLPKSPP